MSGLLPHLGRAAMAAPIASSSRAFTTSSVVCKVKGEKAKKRMSFHSATPSLAS